MMGDGYEAIYHSEVAWREKFALFPHRCRGTHKWIWFKNGFIKTTKYLVPSGTIIVNTWHSKEYHTWYVVGR